MSDNKTPDLTIHDVIRVYWSLFKKGNLNSEMGINRLKKLVKENNRTTRVIKNIRRELE
jgi:hypothetical protein